MKWLPYHTFEIRTALKPELVVASLQVHIEKEKIIRVFQWPNARNDERFEGWIDATDFSIQRVIGYRNSFLPRIYGHIASGGPGAIVSIRMQLPVIAMILLGMVGVVVLSGAVGVAVAGGMPILAFIPLFFASFFYLMAMAGFWMEAPKQEATLRRILNATEV